MACRPMGSRCATGCVLRRVALGLVALGAIAAPAPVDAGAAEGTSDSLAEQDARRAIPWRTLHPADREAVSEVVGGATIYRRLPSRVADCDATLFEYLVDHPEVVVDAWNVMGVSRLRLDPVGPGRYQASDGAGASGEVRVVHRSGGSGGPLTMLVVADGVYQAPPMPSPLAGKSVLLLRAEAVEEANGRSYVTAHLDAFMRFGGPATTLVAKTIRPLLVRTADHNFVETVRFASLFSRTAETNPAGMQRLAGALPRVDEPTRREFAAVCRETAERYAARREGRRHVAVIPASATLR